MSAPHAIHHLLSRRKGSNEAVFPVQDHVRNAELLGDCAYVPIRLVVDRSADYCLDPKAAEHRGENPTPDAQRPFARTGITLARFGRAIIVIVAVKRTKARND